MMATCASMGLKEVLSSGRRDPDAWSRQWSSCLKLLSKSAMIDLQCMRTCTCTVYVKYKVQYQQSYMYSVLPMILYMYSCTCTCVHVGQFNIAAPYAFSVHNISVAPKRQMWSQTLLKPCPLTMPQHFSPGENPKSTKLYYCRELHQTTDYCSTVIDIEWHTLYLYMASRMGMFLMARKLRQSFTR